MLEITAKAEYCGERVCLCVCISVSISLSYMSSLRHVMYAVGCGPILLWQHCDMLFNSRFMENVMFVYNGQE